MTHPLPPIAPVPARFELKPIGSIVGAVDGVWWPRSRDLHDELQQVYPLLRDRVCGLERVCYRYSNWDAAPRKVLIDGDVVRLDGYTTQELDTVRFVGIKSSLVCALIPPGTEQEVAELASVLAMTGALSQFAHAFNVKAAETTSRRHQRQDAERVWDNEGGHAPPASRTAPPVAEVSP
ncbi:hypothetical protein TPB0596_32390 [Tsukamurella pulmonis]|uniref:Uncharacterized protein n=1 Tax=Tsukamurella paurometabola TaxID=2061 RepID=A0A3P8MBQ4_TSUPA|nr:MULTISPECIES: DUF5994 family protein [Tsukamurella]UEA84390.1 DUF5994 family protein [Tsukamurella paurometabola]BDD83476.1 hypothetical protein TPB0596_32390 [Tsukamurella pulmonis]VDR36953.1 Uncharacterised protein [Tsukamurella paurometabola]